jgi:hypothetical protein
LRLVENPIVDWDRRSSEQEDGWVDLVRLNVYDGEKENIDVRG